MLALAKTVAMIGMTLPLASCSTLDMRDLYARSGNLCVRGIHVTVVYDRGGTNERRFRDVLVHGGWNMEEGIPHCDVIIDGSEYNLPLPWRGLWLLIPLGF